MSIYEFGIYFLHLSKVILIIAITLYIRRVFMEKDKATFILNRDTVINQWPDMLIYGSYLTTDTFESGLDYGADTIRKEPPLNRQFYTFDSGASIKYLGSNMWELEASKSKKNAIKDALRKITPVASASPY